MSKTVVFNTYGDADVLHLVDDDAPQPGPGQVRVRVKAAGVQPFDCLFRSGAARQWVQARFPQRIGNEFAGVIDAVGEGVTVFSTGDEVLGWAMLASYAEHVVVAAEQIVAKSAGMPWAEAGVMSASGQTASTALMELGVGKDDTVLIHAAAGGVGTYAVQIARPGAPPSSAPPANPTTTISVPWARSPSFTGTASSSGCEPSRRMVWTPPLSPPVPRRPCTRPSSWSATGSASAPSHSNLSPTSSESAGSARNAPRPGWPSS